MYTHSSNPYVTDRRSSKKKKQDDSDDDEVVLKLNKTPNKGTMLLTSPFMTDFSSKIQDLNLYTPKELCNVHVPDKEMKKVVSPFRISFEDSDDDQYAVTQPLSPQKPLKDCFIFVDVRAENENRSKAISRELERLGAIIADKITNNTSHVVFKNGKNATLNQLKKYPNIHVVSVLWVDSCKTTSSCINESLFPAKLPGSVESPLPAFARAKRLKSLQPKTFQEDLNNSAKKEERRKRRLKKQNKAPNTPIDQIICLDSQEYIKSSDLYKLVATPRAIPDTPWMVKYINGGDDIDTPSQIRGLSTTSKTTVSNDCEVQELSQDIQCRLNFDPIESDNKENCKESCSTSIGHSPSKRQITTTVIPNEDNNIFIPKTPKRTKVAFSKRTSLCRRQTRSSVGGISTNSVNDTSVRTQETHTVQPVSTPICSKTSIKLQHLNVNTTKQTISNEHNSFKTTKTTKFWFPEEPAEVPALKFNDGSLRNLDISNDNELNNQETPLEKKCHKISTRLSRSSSKSSTQGKNEAKQEIKPDHKPDHKPEVDQNATGKTERNYQVNTNLVENDLRKLSDVEINIVPKKKKKLMSKTKFNFPQDKLISPALKLETADRAKEKHTQVLPLTKTKTKSKRIPSQSNKSFDAHAAITAVENSKKESHIKYENPAVKPIEEEKEFDQSGISIKHTSMSVAYDETIRTIKNVDVLKSNEPVLVKKQVDGIDSISSGSTVQSELHNPPPNYNQFHEALVCDALDSAEKNNDVEEPKERRRSSRIAISRRSSGVDFKISKTFRKVNASKDYTKLSTKKTKAQTFHDFSWATIDTKKEEDANIDEELQCSGKTDISSVNVPHEFSFIHTEDDDEEQDLNVSFVHDEKEGLICLSHATRKEYNDGHCGKEKKNYQVEIGEPVANQHSKTEEQASTNDNRSGNKRDDRPETGTPTNLRSFENPLNERTEVETNTDLSVDNQPDNVVETSDVPDDDEEIVDSRNVVLKPPDEDDSGISDSEEVNIDESQLTEDYSCIETVVTEETSDSQLTEDYSCVGTASTSASRNTENGEPSSKKRTERCEGKTNRPTEIAVKKKITKRTKKEEKIKSAKKKSKPKVSLATTSLHYGEQEYVRAMSRELGGFTLRNNVSPDTTHIVAGGPRRTLNILHGIIRGCWILNPKWVADSSEHGEWLSEEGYEMFQEFPMGKVSRINRTRDGIYNHSKLFSRLPPMYLAEVTSPTHEDMMKLITACGGQLTTSLRKAGVGIGLISCRRKDLRILSEKWILDSITNGRIMPTESYEVRLNLRREHSPSY